MELLPLLPSDTWVPKSLFFQICGALTGLNGSCWAALVPNVGKIGFSSPPSLPDDTTCSGPTSKTPENSVLRYPSK